MPQASPSNHNTKRMESISLNPSQVAKLEKIGQLFIDQLLAEKVVAPKANSTGFWFGGGNMTMDSEGTLWLVGRYRNHGDSRTGLHMGERGLELAIFRSVDEGKSFDKVIALQKSELNIGQREVLSIEGAAIRFTAKGVEVFVSTEKSGIGYPAQIDSYLKPGTGVWTIDLLQADSIDNLANASPVTILETDDPQFIHIKDPFFADLNGRDHLMFCSHPYCWTSSNTGLVPMGESGLEHQKIEFDFFPRGYTWDVAMTRGTAVLSLPQVGDFVDHPVNLLFYDGGECVRDLAEHNQAVKRPRGYSCEELGGLAYLIGGSGSSPTRLSSLSPSFVSPWGTGCSRYVDVLDAGDTYYATWQQSQDDYSQPLVLNKIPKQAVIDIMEA